MRRRRSARRKKNDSAGVASIVMLLMVAALFIYVFQALDIGSILFGGGTSPAAATSALTTTAAATATPWVGSTDDASAAPTDTATTAAGVSTEEIKINPLTLYGVQLGVFDKQENAQTLATQLKPSGASGYVLLDSGQYRVIDSIYYGQADAKTVRDQYKNGSATDASLLKVEVSGFTWKVTAAPEQIAAIRSAMVTMQSQVVVLMDAQKKAQAGQSTTDDIVSAARACARKLTETDDALSQAVDSKSSPVIPKLHEALTESADSLNALAQNGDNATALLSGLKYNIIDILLKLEQKLKSN